MTELTLLQACIRQVKLPCRPKPALAGVDLQFKAGEFVLIAGPPESGKSALCRCLAGIIPLFDDSVLDGDVIFEGNPISQMRLPELAGKIGFVQNDPDNQLFCTDLEDDLAFGPCSLLVDPVEIKRRVTWAMRFVGMSGFEKRAPQSLSGGERQRAALASILTLKPKVLILDRCTDQLDLWGRRDIYRKLRQCCKEDGMSVILVDERLDDLQFLVDRIVVLKEGSLCFDGDSGPEFQPYFANSVLKLRYAALSRTICPTGTDGAIETRHSDCFHPKNPTESRTLPLPDKPAIPPSIVSLRDVCYRYSDSRFSLQRVSLEIGQGEFIALAGTNGAGKTTLAKHINGLLRPQSGEAWVYSFNTRATSSSELSRYIGTCFQDPMLRICSNSVRAEVGFVLKLKKIPKDEIDARVNCILERLGLVSVAEQHPYRLSPGQLQRTALASVLVGRPRFLILDEPTSRISAAKKWEVMELIKEFHEQGVTVLMISHDPEIVVNFSDRLVIMSKGRIVADTATEQWRSNEKELYDLTDSLNPILTESLWTEKPARMSS